MTITFKHFISEGIEDKGIFKALFVVGLPGAGKTYTTRRLSGEISPVVVNTDRASEFMAKKIKQRISSETWEKYFKETSHRMTKNMLYNYINGMLPLFIDSTSNDLSNILQRVGLLESIGYDVGFVFVHSTLEQAKERVRQRENVEQLRAVDEEFIEAVHRESERSRSFLKRKGAFFIDYDPFQTTFGPHDYTLDELFQITQGFFKSSVKNVIGENHIEKLRKEKQKYLVPTIMSDHELRQKIDIWYKT